MSAAANSAEKKMWIAVVAGVISVALHVGVLVGVMNMVFSPSTVVETKQNRFQNRPAMDVTKFEVDPLAAKPVRGGAEMAAPKNDRDVSEKLDRLSQATDEALTAPSALKGKSSEMTAPAEFVKGAEIDWRPRQQIAAVEAPVVKDEDAAMPRKVIAKVRRVNYAEDVVPAADLLAPAAPVVEATTTVDHGLAIDPSLKPADDLMKVADFGNPGDDGLFGFAPDRRRLDDGSGTKPAADKSAAEDVVRETINSSDKMLDAVDEVIVAREKAAVSELRDTGKGKPFAGKVIVTSSTCLDPTDPKWKYFRIKIRPAVTEITDPLPIVPKDVAFLIDSSGSIADDRIRRIQRAVSELLRTLNSGDRFNVVAFRNRFEYGFPTWMPADKPSFEKADSWLNRLTAHGNTDVFQVMRSVLAMPRDPTRPIIALMITDGEATSGMTRSSKILGSFEELNGGLVSIYTYGVKKEANAYLIDMVSQGNRGGSLIHTGLRYSAASGLKDINQRFRDPVLSDLAVQFSAASGAEAYPRLVPNLYRGEVVEINGRCPASTKDLVFSVRGLSGAQPYEDLFEVPLDETKEGAAYLKNAWAKRRIRSMILDYAKSPSKQGLDAMHDFSARFGVPIPYEKSLGGDAK